MQGAKAKAAWYSEAEKHLPSPHACQIVSLEELQATFDSRKAVWVPLHQLQSHVLAWKAAPLANIAIKDVDLLVADTEAKLAGLSSNQQQHPVATLLRDGLAEWKALMSMLEVTYLQS